MKKLLVLPVLLIAKLAFAQTDDSIVKFVNPSTVSKPFGYSQAAVVDLGNSKMLIISGQVALDVKGNLVGNGDIAKQTEQVFQNIKNIVESAGGTMDNIVKLNYYTTDASKIQALRATRDRFVNVKNPPASTLMQVSKLFRPDILIEIEATAIIPKK